MLGPVDVIGPDGATSLAGMNARLLTALLVAQGRTSGTDELVEAMWNGSPPRSARKLVSVYVSQLRKFLPAQVEIETRRGGYALSVAPDALDSSRFERLLRESREAREAGNAELDEVVAIALAG